MSRYDTLNPMQQEAVFQTEGPVLILAGAGSGKTRVLTHRTAYLIEEKGVNPYHIMAITFTNKAAGEMRERIDNMVGFGAESVWVSTFHSSCVRILRRHIDRLGYDTRFTIYDTDDQKTLMKDICKRLNIDTKIFRERSFLSAISRAKDELISPEEFALNAGADFAKRKQAEVYREYQSMLLKNNALDFDDLIMKTVELFRADPQVLDYYQERFRYLMVDEYQDTNTAQFQFVSLLAGKYKNLCVVGDDDQSIYKFRGANIRNILSFEETFPGARVVKLEQNYRSTSHILDAANAVIRNNQGRRDKTLWTANGEGVPVVFCHYERAHDEAEGIVRDLMAEGRDLKDYAVLYRTNAQSRLLEEQCIAYNIPYRLVGGVNFYQRKEIKDILSYLKTIANGRDDLAVQRIINVPKRGIGATSVGRVAAWALEKEVSFYKGCTQAAQVPGLGKAAGKVQMFVGQIESFHRRFQEGELDLKQLIEAVLEETGYREELELTEEEVEAKARLENIEELVSKAVSYWQDQEHPTLDGFLEEVALVADVDRMDDSESRVTLMTLHSAKGLEFPVVYLSGMEDGLFPSSMSIMSEDKTDLEEERRLCYVGITRARERLVLTGAKLRMIKGDTRYSRISRFVEEIPEDLVDIRRPGAAREKWGKRSQQGESGLPWNQSQKSLGISRFGAKSNSYESPTASYRQAGFAGGGSGGGAAGGSGSGSGGGLGRTPAFGKAFTVEKAGGLDYEAGSRVRHGKFGLGTVQAVKDGARDYEVTVEFDKAGVKKMFASFAKLERVEDA